MCLWLTSVLTNTQGSRTSILIVLPAPAQIKKTYRTEVRLVSCDFKQHSLFKKTIFKSRFVKITMLTGENRHYNTVENTNKQTITTGNNWMDKRLEGKGKKGIYNRDHRRRREERLWTSTHRPTSYCGNVNIRLRTRGQASRSLNVVAPKAVNTVSEAKVLKDTYAFLCYWLLFYLWNTYHGNIRIIIIIIISILLFIYKKM